MRRLVTLAIATLAIVFPAFPSFGQQHENVAKGFAADKVYQFNDVDQINMFNLALNVGIPIGPAFHVNGPLSYGITLRYSGNNWENHARSQNTVSPDGHTTTTYYYASIPYAYAADAELHWNAGLGWNIGFGRLIAPPKEPSLAWTYESGDGGKHAFFATLHELNTHETAASGRDQYNHSFVEYTSDNSYLRMVVVTVGSTRYRDVEFPDGMIHRFSYDGGDVLSIRDRFGNQITFTTTFDDFNGTKQLAINDGIRTSYVNYKILGPFDPLQYTPGVLYVVTSVDFPAFKPAGAATTPRAVYTFRYGTAASGAISYASDAQDAPARISRRLPESGNLDCQVSPAAQAPVLTKVTLPDGSSFEMHYDVGDGGASYSASYIQNPTTGAAPNPPAPFTVCGGAALAASGFSGNLVSLRLPTLGTIEWDYSRYGFPAEGAVSHQRMDKDPQATSVTRTPLQYSVGVRERRERAANGDVLGKRTYVGRYYKDLTNDSAYALLTTMKTWTGFDTSGLGGTVFSRNVSYFSVGQSGAGVAHTGEYSLPFTRYAIGGSSGNIDPEAAPSSANARYTESDPVVSVANPDPQDGTRFLSSKLYDENGKLRQYTYVAYQGDDPDLAAGQQGDRRENARRTVWNTSDSVFSNDAVSASSDFDGLGHYRSTAENGTGYAAGSSRTTAVAFNRTDPDVGGDLFDSGTYDPANPNATAFHMLASGDASAVPPVAPAPWILNLYSSQARSDASGSARTLACFDPQTGFLQRTRTMKGTIPATDDLITAFGHDLGNVISEKYYGGDPGPYYGGQRPALPTTQLCSAPLPVAEYFIAHAFDYGTQARTWFVKDSDLTPAPFWTQNDVIDPTGIVAASYDRSDLGTAYSYDPMGRLVQANPPGQVPILYAYTNAAGTARATVNIRRDDGGSNKPEFEYQFDSFGRIVLERERTAANGFAERSTAYDAVGQKSFVSEWSSPASTKGTTTTYDVFGRPKTITAPDSKTMSLTYTGTNTIVRSVPIRTNLITGETLATTTESYDLFHRLVGVREPSGALGAAVDTQYSYDVSNRLLSVKTFVSGAVPDQTRTFSYDGRGFLLSAASPEKTAAVLYRAYDARGHVTQTIDGPNDLSYVYDPWERLTTLKNTGGSDIKTFTFATANLPSGCTTGCSDFLRGKLVSATRKQTDPALGGEVSVTETYDYARASGQVSDRKTEIASTTAFTGATFNTFQDYNPLGALQIVGYPKCLAPTACAAATPARDSDAAYYSYTNGWLSFVGGNGPAYATMTYHPNGLIKTVAHTNGVDETTAMDPNAIARPCAIFATGKGSQLVDDASAPCGKSIAGGAGVQWSTGEYKYDGAGNIRQIGPKQYAYDGVSRLVSETESGDSPTASYRLSTDYKYDAFGNMIEQAMSRQAVSILPGSDGVVTRVRIPIPVDAATNRLASRAYDAAGNLTASGNDLAVGSAYTWDSVGTMRSLSENARELHFLYTADDERVAVVSLVSADPASRKATSWTLRGLGGQVLRTVIDDQSSGTHVWSWSGDEIYRGAALLADVTPAGRRHFVLDHLGSPRLITDESATGNPQTNVFSSFGAGGTTGSGPLQFTGHERDFGTDSSRTLDYMHARYYSASVGRFLSVDPLVDIQKSLMMPQRWNRYAYVVNNPIRFSDPTGRDEREGWQAGVVVNQSSQIVYIAGDHKVGDHNETVVIPLGPGESSSAYLTDADAVVVAPGQSIDGASAGGFKIGASTVEINGSSPGQISVTRGIGYVVNAAIGHAGQFNVATGQQNSWVAPATPQARAAAAKRAQQLKREKQRAAQQRRTEEQRQRKDQEHHWWQFWR